MGIIPTDYPTSNGLICVREHTTLFVFLFPLFAVSFEFRQASLLDGEGFSIVVLTVEPLLVGFAFVALWTGTLQKVVICVLDPELATVGVKSGV